MNPVSLRRAGILALSLALLSLVIIGFLSQRNWREFELSAGQARDTQRILTLNETILGRVRDAEASQRGYLLTHKAEYLLPFKAAVEAVPREISELLSLTRSRESQWQRVQQLQAATNQKMREMQRTIDLRDAEGLDEAVDVVRSGRGQAWMEQIRRLSSEIEADVYQQWSDSSAAVQFHANQARQLTITGVLLLAFLLISAFIANQSAAAQREQLITQLAGANRSTTEVRDLLRTTLYSIGDAVITVDRDGAVQLMNSVAERLTGRSEAESEGRPIEDIFRTRADGENASESNLVRGALSSGALQSPGSNIRVISKSGEETPIDVSAAPIRGGDGALRGCVLVFRDVGERLRNEEKLRETAKLESLGVLAGGIAHDFNNLLVGILGNASLLREDLPPDFPGMELLDGVERAGERAAQLTQQMLAYSGRGHFVVRSMDLSKEVQQITALVHASIPKNVDLRLSLKDGLPAVEADAGQLQQVVMNLVINAAEAVGAKRGSVEIATASQTVVDDRPVITVLGERIRPGRYVVLRVTDSGCGMDEATRARIFDPFFTTKFTGRGLGLAAVLGIAKGHNGGIQVESALGVGSTFRVFFPVPAEQYAPTTAAPVAALAPGRGKILVVDDEISVRSMVRNVLERAGYEVILASNGAEAVEVFAQDAGEIALILLDMTMPIMSGEEALPKLRSIRKEVRVIASSGYNEVEALAKFGQDIDGFIQKPYTAAQLAQKIRTTLGIGRGA
ncbi:MAG TPA: CHASE3 domain-containing protein [Bryobacteraceae bacterium]